jgi:predicted alpha/beta-hydrolase family hydrolase
MDTLEIAVGAGVVSGLLQDTPAARACYVFAHGAGAGMTHPFMAAVSTGLFERGVSTLRYQFPYMEKGSRRPDIPSIAHFTVRAAVAEASRLCPGLPLFAGGKSFGGRMTSQTQAQYPLPRVQGLAFVGFPLHPAGKPSDDRARHLFEISIPMLFLQGDSDKMAELSLIDPLAEALGAQATLRVFEHADHSFHAPVRSGRNDQEVMHDMLDAMVAWMDRLI